MGLALGLVLGLGLVWFQVLVFVRIGVSFGHITYIHTTYILHS